MEFKKFYNLLSWELKQSSLEDHDSNYEYINFDDAMYYTNECIKELVEMNGNPFTTEEDFSFPEVTTIYRLPDMYNSASGYFFNDQWFKISDSSDQYARVRCINDRDLIFNPAIQVGEKITMRVVKYPADICTGSDSVVFPPQFQRLLRLHIANRVMGRKGKEMAQRITIEYERLLARWQLYGKTVKTSSFMQFGGYGFGR